MSTVHEDCDVHRLYEFGLGPLASVLLLLQILQHCFQYDFTGSQTYDALH